MDLILAKHKSCVITLGEGDDWISIYSCKSSEKGKGHATEAILIIKENYKHKKLMGSVPLNNVMKHVYDKCGVEYA